MWVETKVRIIEILKTLTAPIGTYYNVADSTPPTRSDHHNYLIRVKSKRDTVQPQTSSDSNTHILNFEIECTSQQVLTGLPIVNETNNEAYADAITALLERYPSLGDPTTKKGLTGVQKIFMPGAVFQTPTPYSDSQHYGVTVNLQVTFKRATGC